MPMMELKSMKMHCEIVDQCMDRDTLFIHGNLASNRWWYPSVEILKAKSKIGGGQGRAILAEWRGCGQSTGAETTFSIQDLANDYVELIESINCSEPVNVIGHSTGGIIALMAMHERSDLFSRAILLDPVGAKGIVFDESMYDAFAKMSTDRPLLQAVMETTVRGCEPTSPQMQAIFDDAQSAVGSVGKRILDAFKDFDVTAKMKEINHPIRVFHGDEDVILPLQDSKDLAALLPNGRYTELGGYGHSMNIESPEKFADLVLQEWS